VQNTSFERAFNPLSKSGNIVGQKATQKIKLKLPLWKAPSQAEIFKPSFKNQRKNKEKALPNTKSREIIAEMYSH